MERLINSPILVSEERKSKDAPKIKGEEEWYNTQWTFYEFATIKGSVTLRWYSAASKYYSEDVDFFQIS